MGIFKNIKQIMTNNWITKSEQTFGFKIPQIDTSDLSLNVAIYSNNPPWLEDGIKTIGMAATICAEIRQLTTMNIGIEVTGSKRADFLNEQMQSLIIPNIKDWCELACATGEIILKPNGTSVDCLLPYQYRIIEEIGKKITKIVFIDEYYNAKTQLWDTRLEFHTIDENNLYTISNRCFVGRTQRSFQTSVPIEMTRWKDLNEDIQLVGVTEILAGRFRIPGLNNSTLKSGCSVFCKAITELEDLDIAYSRFSKENYDSKRTVLLDSDRLMMGGRIGAANRDIMIKQQGLPDYVKAVEGVGDGSFYHEINPTLNTETRIKGINTLLSQIGFKCGFSNGYFVFNEKTGMVTATQVESDDRRTLQTISAIRDALKDCVNQLVYALNKLADCYKLCPSGSYEIIYDMQDLTQNHEEDAARWFSYVQQGYVPFWYYLTKFEGMSEAEAKKIQAEAEKDEIEFEDEEDELGAGEQEDEEE